MKLPVPSLFSKKDTPEYYLALLLHDEKAHAVIIKEHLGKVHMVGKGESYFSLSIEDVPLEELLNILDKVISKAEEELPSDIETHKTIFGVKESWVEDKKIKKDYLTKLKKVCDELHLEPTGFLVLTEAIAHLIQEEEGAPVTAILAHVAKRRVTISLIRVGRIVETKRSLIEESAVKTVDTLLKHIEHADILPTRIIVYADHDEDSLAQEFISHQWSKSLSFLHMPQVSLLPLGFDTKAIIFGAATQLGFEMADQALAKSKDDIKTLDTHTLAAAHIHTSEQAENVGKIGETPDEENAPMPIAATGTGAEAFGFALDKDIADTLGNSGPETATPVAETPTTKHHDAIGNVVIPTGNKEQGYKIHHYSDDETRDDFAVAVDKKNRLAEEADGETDKRQERKSLPLIAIMLEKSKQLLALPLGLLKRVGGIVGAGNKMTFLLPPVIILGLIALVLLYIFNVKAAIILTVSPKTIDQSQSVTFSLSSGNDFSNNTVSAKGVTATVDGGVSTPTTGKKQTGDQAKGTVTIYNNSNNPKTFSKGSTITSSNNLDFLLDKDVSVASASGDIFSGTKPGTADVPVVAKTFGTEYNLPSGTKFSVGGNSDFAAKNASAFSGGTKKDVQVVAKADIDKLLSDLPKSLEGKAKSDISQKIDGSDTLFPDFIAETVTKKTTDKSIGDEAKTVTMKGSVKFDSATYKKDDIKAYATFLIKDKFLQDLTLSDNSLSTTLSDIQKQPDDTIRATAHIQAGLLPKIDTDKTISSVINKSVTDAKDTLSKLPQVKSVTIKISPAIPFLSNKLPRFKNHISVSVTQ